MKKKKIYKKMKNLIFLLILIFLFIKSTELKLDKIYKNGLKRICQVMKKEPIHTEMWLNVKKLKDPIHVSLILDYVDKSTIILDNYKYPKRSNYGFCFMYLKMDINETFILKTERFIVDKYLEDNLYSFFLGFIDEMFDLNWESVKSTKWKLLSRDWVNKEKIKFVKQFKIFEDKMVEEYYSSLPFSQKLYNFFITLFLAILGLFIFIICMIIITCLFYEDDSFDYDSEFSENKDN